MEQGPSDQQQLLNSDDSKDYEKGEKLYVTADKRGEKGGCKRPLCWTLLVLLVAAVVALIVLAATGILFSSSPTTVEQYNTSSISSARAFGGLGVHDHEHDHHDHDNAQDHHDHDHDHDHSQHEHGQMSTEPNHPNQHGPEIQSDEAEVHATPEESDMSVYVPRTVEGELKIDNEEFTSELEDTDSTEYKEFVSTFTDGLKRALFNRSALENGNNDISIEVIKLKKGSVIVTYRIHWKPKSDSEQTTELMTAESLQKQLDEYLEKNNRMINIFHVAEEKHLTKLVLDVCQMDNNSCEYGCEFDESILDFTCTCPHGQILEITNPKRCMSILDNAYPLDHNEERDYKVLTVESNPSTMKTVPEEEKPTVIEHDSNYDWKETDHVTGQEPNINSETELNFSHILGHEHDHVAAVSAPEPNAEPQPEPTSEPVAEPTAEPTPASKTSSEYSDASLEVIPQKPESTPEPTVELTAEPQPKAEPLPVSEPEPTAEPKPEPEPAVDSTSEPEPVAEPKSEPEPTAEPKSEPEPTVESKSEPEPTMEPKSEPVPIYVSMSNSEPIAEPKLEREPTTEPTSEPEPTAELKAEPEHIVEMNTESEKTIDINPARESITESKFEPEPLEPKSEPEPTPEPQAEPEIGSALKTSEDSTTMKIFSHESSHIIEGVPATEQYLHQSDHVSEHHKDKIYENEKPQLIITNGEIWHVNSQDNLETTTVKGTTDESDHEIIPDFISILTHSKVNDSEPTVVTTENNTETTDWLEDRKHENNEYNEYEGRAFKTIDAFLENINTNRSDFKNVDVKEVTIKPETKTNTNTEPLPNELLINENIKNTMSNEASDNVKAAIESAMNEWRKSNESATEIPAPIREVSLDEQKENEEEKNLMKALVTKKQEIEVTTEDKIDEGLDITFDTINMLYNRSSKAIEDEDEGKMDVTESNVNVVTTTESDWLSEPVTEVTFEDAISSLNKEQTTEPVARQVVEAVMKTGVTKDDFEPDYLNTNNKMQDQDEPMYGMTHDYDSEDSRVKRVNIIPTKEPKNITTQLETTTESLVPIESSTVVQYIYGSSNTEEPKIKETDSTTFTNLPFTNEPAPVWEDTDRDLRVKEIDKKMDIEKEPTTPSVIIDENIAPRISTSTSAVVVPETLDKNGLTHTENQSQNTTQVNNLNVTIYEISSHNNSLSVPKPHSQSDEYEDQETEMNPFLPEIENNKVLVKKLQEGHDIEPVVNETHNENVEENKSVTESTSTEASINGSTIVVKFTEISTTAATVTPDTDTTFNDLLRTNSMSNPTDVMAASTDQERKKEAKASISIPTFLLDTDDLDTPTQKSTAAENSLESAAVTPLSDEENNDSEYLSVVPIEDKRLDEDEALKKRYVNKNIQEFNDISDSPKKSDRRTIDITKFDSVINNEA